MGPVCVRAGWVVCARCTCPPGQRRARATQPPGHKDKLPGRPMTAVAQGRFGAQGAAGEAQHSLIAVWHNQKPQTIPPLFRFSEFCSKSHGVTFRRFPPPHPLGSHRPWGLDPSRQATPPVWIIVGDRKIANMSVSAFDGHAHTNFAPPSWGHLGRNLGHLGRNLAILVGIEATMYSHVAKHHASNGVKPQLPKKGGANAKPSWRASP